MRIEIPPSSTRIEMLNYAKTEFERNKKITDSVSASSFDLFLTKKLTLKNHIKYLLSAGKAEFDTMRRYIDELASVNR